MSWIFLEIPAGISWKSPGNLFSYICRHPGSNIMLVFDNSDQPVP